MMWYIHSGSNNILDKWRPRRIARTISLPSNVYYVIGAYTKVEFAKLYRSWAIFTHDSVESISPENDTTRYIYYVPSNQDTISLNDMYLDLDVGLQYYFASNMLSSRILSDDAPICHTMSYIDIMTYIQNLPIKQIPVETDMGFPSIWTGGRVTPKKRCRTRRRRSSTKTQKPDA
jgi:hypothetical protein